MTAPFIRIALFAGVSALAAASPSLPDTPASPPAASASPAASGTSGAKEKEGTFTIVNKTSWEIAAVHVTPAEDDTWTANLLKRKLAPGATVKLTVVCDETDVKLVDAHGHTCLSESMYPCGRHSTWTITNESIAGCKTFGQ